MLLGALQPSERTLRYLEIQWDPARIMEKDNIITSLKAFGFLEIIIIHEHCFHSDEVVEEVVTAQPKSKLSAVLPQLLNRTA